MAVEAGEIFQKPSLGREWTDPERLYRGIARLISVGVAPAIQIEFIEPPGKKPVAIYAKNYDWARGLIREAGEFENWVNQQIADT